MKSNLRILLFTGCLLSIVSTAKAALLAYEGFDYAASTPLNGLTGGTGWANAWSAPAAAVTATGLGYTDGLGNSLVTTGSCAYFNTLANAASIQARRTNSFVRNDANTTTWVSFIGQYGGNDVVRSAGFQLHTNTTERLSIGKGTTNVPPPGTWSMLHGGAVANSVFTTNTITNVTFLVLRIDHHAGANDDAYLFVNPLLPTEPNIASASAAKIGQAELSFNSVRAFTAYVAPNYADLRLDEIRMGDSYADVTPYLPVTVVQNTNDSGPGSLRQAVLDAPAGGVITFTNTLSGQTIPLSSGQIVLNKNLTINGAALPNGVTISGGNVSRIFQVNSGATNSLLNLTLSGGNGVGALASGSGGAIYNEGSLALTACTVSSNSCASGGGGIFSQNSSSRLALTNCTVARNTASFAGGFLFRNSSIVSLVHCTVATNSGSGGSGGVVLESSATLALQNTIIAGNPDINGGEDIGGAGGTLTRSGNNLIGVQPAFYPAVAPVGAPNANGDYVGTSGSPVAALLAPLGNYGGLTPTMPPLPSSLVIDKCATTALTTDQRGFTRTIGTAADIGAVEVQINTVASSLVVTTNNDLLTENPANGVSLRSAVAYAATNATITFAPNLSGQTILLTNGQITLTKNVTIDGSALANAVQLNGGHTNRIFSVNNGVTAALSTLLITNGYASDGGGIFNSGTLTLNSSTLVNNTAINNGGGIYDAGTLVINNSTFAGNLGGIGGGIADLGTVTINNSTLANNLAGHAGGIYVGASSTLNLTNSIVSSTSGGVLNSGGSFSSSSNLVDVAGINLAPLANYGGPTPTMPPLPGSPAIDAGAATALTTDQRGFTRTIGAVDIGAVETGNPVPGFIAIVTTNSDAVDGDLVNGVSLREAVAFATNGATITFAPNLSGQTILLTNAAGEIVLSKSVTIDGSSLASAVQLNGNGVSRIFYVNTGVTVTNNSLIITNGFVNNIFGGGIYNLGNLTVNNSTIANNSANFGGGIYSSGTLTVNNSAVVNNTAGAGGGFYNNGTLKINNSTIANNSALVGSGGGIYFNSGALTVNNTTIVNNSVSFDRGGGIYANITLNLTNSIVCNNTASVDPNIQNGTYSGVNNLVNVNPNLAPLANYGGPTLTMPPLPGSPAIDAGNNTAASGLTTDQRGFTRTIGTVDIGAVETGNVIPGYTVVTATNDGIDGFDVNGVSLREAVAFAPTNATITFAPNLSGQTIMVTNGHITLTKNVTIDGSALASAVQLNGGHTNRIFYVDRPVTNTLNSLIITNGFAYGDAGGGILNFAYAGILTLNNITLANNSSLYGGGICNVHGTLTVNNSTIVNNSSSGEGGGIFNLATLTVNNSTIANNSSSGSFGGGIHNEAQFNLNNSIVCSNTASIGGQNIDGSITSSANNLVDTNALLAPLGNYGGPTPTMPPLPSSPAIDAGSDAATNGFSTDQRGLPRKIGAHVDIGAVEYQTVLSPLIVMPGNGSNGFGGSIGQGSLTLVDDGTNIFGTLYRGPDTLRDDLVFYIDSVSGGFSHTASFADGGDGLRKAISGFDGGGNRSVLTNLPGFTADYAIALGPDSEHFGGLWRLTAGGTDSLQYSNSVNLSPLVNNAVAYTFSFPVQSIGLQPGSGGTFRFFGTLISSTGFRSDEALPGNVSGPQGWSPFNVTAVASYTIQGSLPVTSPFLTGATRLGNGSFQFSFTNVAGANLTVWASTNVMVPFAQWSNLGAPVESPAGTFTFTDPQAVNSPQRFYRVSSP